MVQRILYEKVGDKMTVDIICPLYNAEDYLEDLQASLLAQKNVNINKILYVLTESKDKTEELLKKNKLNYKKIKKENFSHSTVRETEAKESTADIIVFITQDIVIERKDWLSNLVKPIIKKEAAASYSRQLTKYNNIEKYTRMYNYPNKSFLRSKKDLNTYGLKTFFFSDASSAIDRKIFEQLNYYDGKKLPISEDMYIAYKLINSDYKIKYCADSVIYHSHNFKLSELYQRYKLTGQFFRENAYLDYYGTNKSGGGLAKFIFKEAIKDKNIKVLVRYIPDMAARFIGMKFGKWGF